MGGERRGEEGISGDDVEDVGECVEVYAECSTREVGVIGRADKGLGFSRGCMSVHMKVQERGTVEP